jgi:hypothetical protein
MAEDIPPLRWIVPTFIPEGLTILGAKQKIGKSWMVYGLGIAVTSGGMFLGQRVDAGEALYLALEDGKRRLQSRGRTLLGNAPVPAGLHLETAWPRLDAGGMGRLERWLKAHEGHARVVIIDVFQRIRPPHARYADAYAEDYATLGALKALADAYHVAVVILHHTRKASAADIFDELLGSAGIGGAADTLLVLARERGQRDAQLHITGREIEEETTYAIRFDRDTCAWQMLGDAAEHALSQQRRKIFEAVQERGKASPKEIAERIGDPGRYNTIKNVVLDMARDHQLVSNNDGTYSCGSLSSLGSLKGSQPAPVQGGLQTTSEQRGSLGSLNAQNGKPDYSDYSDYSNATRVVSDSLSAGQATSGLGSYETTQTTQTTANDAEVPLREYLMSPCPHCHGAHVYCLPNREIWCEDCGKRLAALREVPEVPHAAP